MTQAAASRPLENHAVRLLEQHFTRSNEEGLQGAVHPSPSPALWGPALLEPLSDFLSRPGKEFRARLVRLSWELAGRHKPLPDELALIVEALHAGSLIVDDIEDGSSYRRGAPCLHQSYGVPIALNAGNWLYFWPAELLFQLDLPPATELALHRVIGRTLLACHEGQALDLSTQIAEVEQTRVPALVHTITQLKSGKLFELAAALGAIAAGAPSSTVRALGEFGLELGTGLQMLDDLSGITQQKRCHKGHEDLRAGRPTWLWAWAAERTDQLSYGRLRELGREVRASGLHPEHLALALKERASEHGARGIRAHLSSALDRLRTAVGPSRALDEIHSEIRSLEQSFG
ncbi:MAG TPA: polyprenyl synthetase family protein [Polyangiaceae bacterium]|nr:polyprenyl synthetase family protein [Polyangiaceae bacterium]